MSRTKWLVAILSLVTAGVLLLLPRGGAPPSTTEILARSITLHGYSASGESQWEIHAAEGTLANEEGTLRDVAIRFYGDGEPLTVTGTELIRTREESLMRGAVQIAREGGLLLETSDLMWNEAAGELNAGPARLEDGDISLSAERFSYDLSARAARFGGGVTASFDAGTLTAEDAEWNDDGLAASGDVTLHVDLAALEAADGS